MVYQGMLQDSTTWYFTARFTHIALDGGYQPFLSTVWPLFHCKDSCIPLDILSAEK